MMLTCFTDRIAVLVTHQPFLLHRCGWRQCHRCSGPMPSFWVPSLPWAPTTGSITIATGKHVSSLSRTIDHHLFLHDLPLSLRDPFAVEMIRKGARVPKDSFIKIHI